MTSNIFNGLMIAACMLAAWQSGLAQQPAAAATEKPNIVILATRGTIAGVAATGTQSGYTSGAVTFDAMLAAVPGIPRMSSTRRRLAFCSRWHCSSPRSPGDLQQRCRSRCRSTEAFQCP
jgi:L-asparaginase/Glu-tRNA(Gln) amidotransferase subunit D